MRSIPVSENVIQLTRVRFVNAFLVREEDGFTLVDTTTWRGGDALIASAAREGGAIRRIALTHGHGDHVGSLDALTGRLGSSVPVLMPERRDRNRR
jgi:glyoxylase-like metal-dependent hydrolase (beta-lactamase superfamily II)